MADLYRGAHSRTVKVRGPATDYDCLACGVRPAAEWAYRGGDPQEMRAPSNGAMCAYSDNPSYYDPLCRPCHRFRDGHGPPDAGPGQLVLPFDSL